MPITFKCSCGKALKVPDGAAGKKGKCPACGAVVTVPGGAPAKAPPPPPEPEPEAEAPPEEEPPAEEPPAEEPPAEEEEAPKRPSRLGKRGRLGDKGAGKPSRYAKKEADEGGDAPKSGKKKWIMIVLLLVVVGAGTAVGLHFAGIIQIPGLPPKAKPEEGGGQPAPAANDPAANEKAAVEALKSVLAAQMRFKEGDVDKNGAPDYWTGDVAGLHGIGKTLPEQPIAAADAGRFAGDYKSADGSVAYDKAAVGAEVPYKGYRFKALTTDNEGQPYKLAPPSDPMAAGCFNPVKFAVCAYPAEPGKSGKLTFLVSEGNAILSKDTGGAPVDAWPKDAAAEGWVAVP